ncbi:hypothetical protein DFH07DRAFT_772879 [Mycena maculata]|uniref:Uncharacterized protein n=1 Tax=Mycena maculata TaxID=230809 RepID=A0AAD7NDG5_9AGAR|nr:hypothetical protein DFH07DRAFT_772879 [Mycena maculata]
MHYTFPLVCFALIFVILGLFVFLELGRTFPPAFPLLRTLYVTMLMTGPILGFCMCGFYLLCMIRDLFRSWNHRQQRYTPLAVDMDDFTQGGDDETLPSMRKRFKEIGRPERNVGWLGHPVLVLFGLYLLCTYELPIDHRFKSVVELANCVLRREGYGTGGALVLSMGNSTKQRPEKIFIAAMFHDNSLVLPYWTTEISKLINYLGPSYSSDNSPSLLREFDTKLEAMRVPRRILTQDTSIVRPSSMATAPPRVEYLAAAWNLAMEPLAKQGGYDRVLFSNDIFVEAEAIAIRFIGSARPSGVPGVHVVAILSRGHGGSARSWWTNPRRFSLAGTESSASVRTPSCRSSCAPAISPPPRSPAPSPQRTPRTRSPRTAHRPPPLGPRRVLLLRVVQPPLRPAAAVRAGAHIRESACGHGVCVEVLSVVQWFIENVENGNKIHLAKLVLGDPRDVWQWDGGECHPCSGNREHRYLENQHLAR